MEGLATFFAMGGYAEFVWPSFGLTAAVLAGLYVVSRRAFNRAEAELAVLQASMPARTRPADAADEA